MAVSALSNIVASNETVISHGNGPQVGLLAIERGASTGGAPYPLDLLDAETEGMLGYVIQQEIDNVLEPPARSVALVTQVEVDPHDPAFSLPTKPIGPVYQLAQTRTLADDFGWTFTADGDGYRRTVASPEPQQIIEIEIIRQLLAMNVTVICAGGGGVPVIQQPGGALLGIEAVIDKDLASALLGVEVGAQVLMLLTDVDAVYEAWDEPDARAIKLIGPAEARRYEFAAGSMAPKVEAACRFVEQTGGRALIGKLDDAAMLLRGEAGTTVIDSEIKTWWPAPR